MRFGCPTELSGDSGNGINEQVIENLEVVSFSDDMRDLTEREIDR